MGRARTFLKCEIKDAISLAATHGVEVRLMPTGELRVIPANHNEPQLKTIDHDDQSEADKAFSEWENEFGGQIEGRS